MIRYNCPECNEPIAVSPAKGGTQYVCPLCGKATTVPAAEPHPLEVQMAANREQRLEEVRRQREELEARRAARPQEELHGQATPPPPAPVPLHQLGEEVVITRYVIAPGVKWGTVISIVIVFLLVFGHVHVLTGSLVGGFLVLPKASFSLSETFVNTDALGNMPVISAKSRFPLTVLALERADIIEDDEEREARVKREIQEEQEKAQREFEADMERQRAIYGF